MDSNVVASIFDFAFDNPNFSDRVLSIEIIPDPVQTQPNATADLATHDGDEARSRELSAVLRVKTVHINSAILAVKSPFFFKLFSNGMRESEQRVATLQIYASEETALMELLNFMYNNTLTTTRPSVLLDIFMAADKFEVASCIQYCSQRLNKLPMTCEFALSCLDRLSSVLLSDAFQRLADSAKQFIAVTFNDKNKFENQFLNLSLAGVETILSSDDIQVPSENDVYDFVLKWAELHYPQLEERRGILETRLRHLIRFPHMTSQKLKTVLTDTNFSPEVASKIVVEALFFKMETPYRKCQLALGRHVAGDTIVNADRSFVERAYMCRPVQVVELKFPHHHCVVYLDLKREECVRLYPDGKIISEPFYLGEQGFFLSAHCNKDRGNISQCFGIYLGMQENKSASCAVEYEFAALLKGEEDYTRKAIFSHTFTGGHSAGMGTENLFARTWPAFIADDSPYFINNILHLKVVVTLK
ncbi:BTB/POZ domain-containing protein POB1 [Heracleum sosnowskyi]|uniref:BTB/POZ domain-containing protein POB1 n=1 Tax=Heracleum sosnowskyi TaxID=360622 RepID=A0AAD8MMH6_9APIA|nr:BTB/POZ domain-containing protein POB1 [Heracleum sosnowskyi]